MKVKKKTALAITIILGTLLAKYAELKPLTIVIITGLGLIGLLIYQDYTYQGAITQ